MKTIITTVGTSLLGLIDYKDIDKNIKDKGFGEWDAYTHSINQVGIKLNAKIDKAKKETLCAEVQTILQIRKECDCQVETVLICTDTILSVICAEVMKPFLENQGVSVHFERTYEFVIKGLQVEGKGSSQRFSEEGFPNLIKRIRQIEKNCSNRPILNISGGYKALIPVMTLMGQLYDMEVCYMYEDGEELIRIGVLPLNFDWSVINYYGQFLTQEKVSASKLSEVEISIMDEMVELGVFHKANLNYKRTLIGELFAEYMDEEHPLADNALGFLMEYKVYEYLINYESHQVRVERSVKLLSRELDLVSTYPDGSFAVGEVKSFIQVQRAYATNDKSLSQQVKAQFEEFKANNSFPKRYTLFIHMQYFFDLKLLLSNLRMLRQEIHEISGEKTLFNARFFRLDYRLTDRNFYKNPYAKIGTLKLKKESLKEITF
jgi:putative CRISPR-associated protein (TIGR02619 family)